jgi:hypothetical protein
MAIEQAVNSAVIDLVSHSRWHSPAELPLPLQFLRSGHVRRTATRVLFFFQRQIDITSLFYHWTRIGIIRLACETHMLLHAYKIVI